mgnify:CR=1 FL=1
MADRVKIFYMGRWIRRAELFRNGDRMPEVYTNVNFVMYRQAPDQDSPELFDINDLPGPVEEVFEAGTRCGVERAKKAGKLKNVLEMN